MNSNITLPFLGFLQTRRAYTGPAPSLRIAATRKNRSLLRWMRAAEMSAWQEASPRDFAAQRTVRGDRPSPALFAMNHA